MSMGITSQQEPIPGLKASSTGLVQQSTAKPAEAAPKLFRDEPQDCLIIGRPSKLRIRLEAWPRSYQPAKPL